MNGDGNAQRPGGRTRDPFSQPIGQVLAERLRVLDGSGG
jgi:hypothetical protein